MVGKRQGDYCRHSADAQINDTLSVRCPAQRQKTAFFDNFIILGGFCASRHPLDQEARCKTAAFSKFEAPCWGDDQAATPRSRILSNKGEICAR